MPIKNWFKKIFGGSAPEPKRANTYKPAQDRVTAPERTNQIREKRLEIAELGIGIDFGTSCTKIVIQDLELKQKWAIPYQKNKMGSNYLFPSSVTLGVDGIFVLSGPGQQFNNIKLKMLGLENQAEKSDDINPVTVVTAYLALLIRESLGWFDSNPRKYIKAKNIQYWLNIGLPAKNCDNEQMVGQFKLVALAAWFAAVDGNKFIIKTIEEALDTAKISLEKPISEADGSRLNFDGNRVTIVPEIIAGIFGYANSTARNDGMYLLVDVGAATLDCAIFNLFEKDGDDRYSIFETDVQQLGVLHYVESIKAHIKELPEEQQIGYETFLELNPLTEPVPELLVNGENIEEPIASFHIECTQMILNMVHAIIVDRNPNAMELLTTFPTFMTGGGRYISFYNRLIPKVEDRLSNMHFNKLEIIELPLPEDLLAPDLMIADYHRLQIAYGLSFHPFWIGEIINKGCIGDIQMDVDIIDYSDRFVDKDMV